MVNNYTPPLPFVTWDGSAHTNGETECVTEMFNAYLECAEWCDRPDDEDWSEACFTTRTMDEAWFDCCMFLKLAGCHIKEWTMPQIGHDLWLTRCGHGTGFWDRDIGTQGDRDYLTKVAKIMREVSVYMDDDGRLCIS